MEGKSPQLEQFLNSSCYAWFGSDSTFSQVQCLTLCCACGLLQHEDTCIKSLMRFVGLGCCPHGVSCCAAKCSVQK